jgi:hypothetical protein
VFIAFWRRLRWSQVFISSQTAIKELPCPRTGPLLSLVAGGRGWSRSCSNCRFVASRKSTNCLSEPSAEQINICKRVLLDRLCGQSSWLQIQRCGFDSQRYQIFWQVVSLEGRPLSLVSTIDRLYGLVVRVPGYRSTGPGSIPSATRFSDKSWVWDGVHSASWVKLTACVV